MNYKVGDKVKIVKNKSNDFEIGDIAIIVDIDKESSLCILCENTNNDEWLTEDEVIPFYYTWEDFLKAPIGTKVTFENGKTLIKLKENGNQFTDNDYFRRYEELVNFKDNYREGFLGKIIRIEEPTYTLVYDSTEQVEEMTLEEVCKELGRNIKIVKDK